jgi:hypothetical protein
MLIDLVSGNKIGVISIFILGLSDFWLPSYNIALTGNSNSLYELSPGT